MRSEINYTTRPPPPLASAHGEEREIARRERREREHSEERDCVRRERVLDS